MFDRLGSAVARRAGWVVAAWAAAAVVLTLLAPSLSKVGVQDETAFLPASSPSQQADRVLHRLFPNDPTLDSALLVFARPGGLRPTDHSYIGSLAESLPARMSVVRSVESAEADHSLAPLLVSPDHASELVVVAFRTAPFTDRTNAAVTAIRRLMTTGAPPGLVAHATGVAPLAADEASGILGSFGRTAAISVLLVLAALLLVYRSLVGALVPLVTIGVSYLVAAGVIAEAAGHGLKVASLAATFMVVMIFGAGTDYCLFLVSRYRQEVAGGADPSAGLRRTGTVIGPVIAASGITVILGFLSQLTARFGMYRTMGPAIGVAIAVTLAAALTLTPALLSLAGRHAFWPTPLRALRDRGEAASARWARIGAAVAARPAEAALGAVIVLLLCASGIGWFHQSFDLVTELPASADARAGYDTLAAHFPAGTLAPVYLVVAADGPIRTDARLAAVDQLTTVLERTPGVAEARSLTQPAGAPLTAATFTAYSGGATGAAAFGMDPNRVDVTPLYNDMASPGGLRFTGPVLRRYPQLLGRLGFFLGGDGDSTRIVVALRGDPYAPSSLATIRQLDSVAATTLAGGPLSGAHLYVGGPASFFSDMQTIGNHDFRVIVAVLIAAIFVVLALLLRSLVAPFYLLATVVLSYAATMGLLVAVFHGAFGISGISFWVPPFLFVILVALGADYNIFIMSRVAEERARGSSVRDAAVAGLVGTGPVISSAGLILAGTFAGLMAAPLPTLRQIGFAVTAGVLIDTFLVRSVLVPAVTVILGRWALWPTGFALEGSARRVQIGVAGAGVAGLAGLLVALPVAGTAAALPAAVPTAAPSALASQHPGVAGVAEASRLGPSLPPGSSAPTGTEPAARAAGASAPTPGAVPGGGAPGPGTPGSPTTSAPGRPPAGSHSMTAPSRIAVPAVGNWSYHVTGTRKIGAAGSTQPFSEDDTTQVSRVGGTDSAPEMRVYTSSGSGTQDDRRLYAPAEVDLVSTQLSSAGLSYGGTFSPPQVLVRWPVVVGTSWSSDWTAGDVHGHTTTTVTGTRTTTVAGRSYTCYAVHSDSTFTGAAQGTQHITSCWVAELGMSAEDQEQFQGTYNGVSFDVNTDAVLTATP